MNSMKEILLEEGYTSEETLVRDVSLLFAMSKSEQYRSECEFFQKKYRMSIDDFDKMLHKKRGIELIEKEEDFEDWEFAVNALKWWEDKVRELKNV